MALDNTGRYRTTSVVSHTRQIIPAQNFIDYTLDSISKGTLLGIVYHLDTDKIYM